jgi:hypothetical protein
MVHPNPWFLITGEEIAALQDIVQALRQDLPDVHQERLSGITGVLNEVRDRRP